VVTIDLGRAIQAAASSCRQRRRHAGLSAAVAAAARLDHEHPPLCSPSTCRTSPRSPANLDTQAIPTRPSIDAGQRPPWRRSESQAMMLRPTINAGALTTSAAKSPSIFPRATSMRARSGGGRQRGHVIDDAWPRDDGDPGKPRRKCRARSQSSAERRSLTRAPGVSESPSPARRDNTLIGSETAANIINGGRQRLHRGGSGGKTR